MLSSRGFELRVDAELFAERRRVKSPEELDGIRRAQGAAVAAMTAIRERIATGEEVEAEELRRLAWHVLIEHGAVPAESLIVASGRASAGPHEEGRGPIQRNQPIVVDIFPRDIASGCWGDLSRTFCLGEPSERLRRCHADVLAALEETIKAIRPGVTGEELNWIAARCLQERGHPTKLDSPGGRTPTEGFAHCVGHGVGLQVHEEPVLDQGCGPVVAGDVLAIEPGIYYEDLGGVRIEDVVLVTEDGCERLADCSYELEIG